MLLSIIIVIALLALMFKVTGLVFTIFGKLLGIILGGLGYMLLGCLAIGVLGIAFFIIPIIFIVGIISIARAII